MWRGDVYSFCFFSFFWCHMILKDITHHIFLVLDCTLWYWNRWTVGKLHDDFNRCLLMEDKNDKVLYDVLFTPCLSWCIKMKKNFITNWYVFVSTVELADHMAMATAAGSQGVVSEKPPHRAVLRSQEPRCSRSFEGDVLAKKLWLEMPFQSIDDDDDDDDDDDERTLPNLIPFGLRSNRFWKVVRFPTFVQKESTDAQTCLLGARWM